MFFLNLVLKLVSSKRITDFRDTVAQDPNSAVQDRNVIVEDRLQKPAELLK